MNDPLQILNDIQIATPCTADWDAMQGTDRMRHCALCDQKVYDISAMTSREAAALVTSSEKVCLRLYRRSDGRVLTRDCLGGKLLLLKRVTRRAMLATASFFGISWLKSWGAPGGRMQGEPGPPSYDERMGDVCPLPPPPRPAAPPAPQEDAAEMEPAPEDECGAVIPLPKVEPPGKLEQLKPFAPPQQKGPVVMMGAPPPALGNVQVPPPRKGLLMGR